MVRSLLAVMGLLALVGLSASSVMAGAWTSTSTSVQGSASAAAANSDETPTTSVSMSGTNSYARAESNEVAEQSGTCGTDCASAMDTTAAVQPEPTFPKLSAPKTRPAVRPAPATTTSTSSTQTAASSLLPIVIEQAVAAEPVTTTPAPDMSVSS